MHISFFEKCPQITNSSLSYHHDEVDGCAPGDILDPPQGIIIIIMQFIDAPRLSPVATAPSSTKKSYAFCHCIDRLMAFYFFGNFAPDCKELWREISAKRTMHENQKQRRICFGCRAICRQLLVILCDLRLTT